MFNKDHLPTFTVAFSCPERTKLFMKDSCELLSPMKAQTYSRAFVAMTNPFFWAATEEYSSFCPSSPLSHRIPASRNCKEYLQSVVSCEKVGLWFAELPGVWQLELIALAIFLSSFFPGASPPKPPKCQPKEGYVD